jgi:hypothetical protein
MGGIDGVTAKIGGHIGDGSKEHHVTVRVFDGMQVSLEKVS